MKIRIIPMSIYDVEFEGKNIKEIQEDYFINYLSKEGKGWYYFGQKGIEANTGDLLLFQMNNSIIACATLDDVIHFKKPTEECNYGALVVEENSIKIFKPIDKEELSQMIIGFIGFNQSKQKFNESDVKLELLMDRMKQKS